MLNECGSTSADIFLVGVVHDLTRVLTSVKDAEQAAQLTGEKASFKHDHSYSVVQ